MKKTALMRVPLEFKTTVFDVARKRKITSTKYLRESGTQLIKNSDELFYSIREIRKKLGL